MSTKATPRIPLDIVVTETGQTTSGVVVAVFESELDALESERNALVWHLMMLANITPQRPIQADELEDVLLHGKEVEDDYETAFGLMHHLAEEIITPERRAAADAWHEARVREAFEKLPQQYPANEETP